MLIEQYFWNIFISFLLSVADDDDDNGDEDDE